MTVEFRDARTNGTGPFELIPFNTIESRPVRWLWRDRIALGKITALAGRPKIGKGLLYTHLVAEVTCWHLAGDLEAPSDVILVTTEDDPGDTLKPRLVAAEADVTRVSMLQMGTRDEPVPFRIPQDADALRQAVEQRHAALVVIDPLVEFVDGKIDSHKSQPVRQAVASLNVIARETGCAILTVFHLNKGNSTDPLLRHEASRKSMKRWKPPPIPGCLSGDSILSSVSNTAESTLCDISKPDGVLPDSLPGRERQVALRVQFELLRTSATRARRRDHDAERN